MRHEGRTSIQMEWSGLASSLLFPEPLVQLIFGFSSGVLLSPFSWGIVWYVIWLAVFEIVLWLISWHWMFSYNSTLRGGIIAVSLLGFIIGREVSGLPVVPSAAETKSSDTGVWWRLW